MATDHPTLEMAQPTDGKKITIAFGYVDGMETAAIFVGDDDCPPPIIITRDALLIAAEQGWGGE